MKHLGPYRKYMIAGAIIQSIIVVVAGYLLFKSRAAKNPLEHEVPEKPGVEQQLKSDN